MKSNCIKINAVIVLTTLLIVALSCNTQSKLLDPVVETQSGLLQGVANPEGTVTSFKGIPYAEPPVGDLRWRKPQPPLPWEGIRDASEFCASCIQNRVYSHLPNGPWTEEFMVQNEVSEDCLFLNIWTPAREASDKLAVFVYLHGGALTEGSGAIDVYDGEELAKKGIVVVTINYRLGVLGFLAHPDLTAESPNKVSGNYGYLDQIAALEWIRQNIAAFGGDPGRVTIAGQSAGAGSVRALIASPLARGLFQRAITQSGSGLVGSDRSTSLVDAEGRGTEFAESKGATSISELRAMPAMEVYMSASGQGPVRFGGVIDGYVLTASHTAVFENGEQNDTPFMTGMNRDELRYRGERSDEFFTLYPVGPDGDTAQVERVAGQEQSRLNAYLWLEHRAKTSSTNGYVYYFNRAIPWPEYPEFGAFHTGEVPYMFNNLKMLDRPWTKVDTMVADVMSSYWVNFTKNGDPNGDGLPVWSAFNSDEKQVMELGEEMGMIPVAASEERFDFLKEQLLGN
jgi:para-nitrobenzyl esterase